MIKIIFVTQDDPFYIPYFFKEFHNIFNDSEIIIEGVIIQSPLGKKSLFKLIKQMYNFYGLINFIFIGTKYIIYKIFSIFAVRIFKGKLFGCFSLEHFLLKKHYSILRLNDINSKESIDLLKTYDLDLIVSIAASQKFKKNILDLPKYGCINIHNAKLPKNRGMLPNFWALFNYDNEPFSGITVHKMNEALDEGKIILQEDFQLDKNESLNNLIIRTKKINAHMIVKVLQLYKNGEPELFPNDSSKATYNTFPSKEDVKNFKKKGLRLL